MSAAPSPPRRSFWATVFAVRGSVSLKVLPRVGVFGVLSTGWLLLHPWAPDLGLQVGPVELAGGVLAALLVTRSNAGYDRWYEARKLWGRIINDTRALVTGGLAYGPDDPAWQRTWSGSCLAFAHATRAALRGQALPAAARAGLGEAAESVAAAAHPPTAVAYHLAVLLRPRPGQTPMPQAAAFHLEAARMRLLDHAGACERILRTPLPRIYLIKVRRFIFLYVGLLPLALVEKVGWATPLLTMLVAYPVLGLDQIAEELEHPFDQRRLDHLPLTEMCDRLEAQLAAARAGPLTPLP